MANLNLPTVAAEESDATPEAATEAEFAFPRPKLRADRFDMNGDWLFGKCCIGRAQNSVDFANNRKASGTRLAEPGDAAGGDLLAANLLDRRSGVCFNQWNLSLFVSTARRRRTNESLW